MPSRTIATGLVAMLSILSANDSSAASTDEPPAVSAPLPQNSTPPDNPGNAGVSVLVAPAAPPPVAGIRPHVFHERGHDRVDDYYWLRDDTRSSAEVLAYLNAENAYTKQALAPTEGLQARLYAELSGRVKQDDDTVPFHRDGYWYYRRFETGREYDQLHRRKAEMTAPEELVLDLDARAQGHDFYRVGAWDVTPDGKLLAWSEDIVSRRQYTIRVREIASGHELPETVPNCSGEVAWGNDNQTFFYIEKDPVTLLGFRVRRHVLGTDPKADPIVWEEPDRTFYTSITRSKSGRFIQILSRSTVATEVRLIDADRPGAPAHLFLPRERDHEYSVEDLGDRFVVRTNWQAKNFRLMLVPADSTADRSQWRDLVAGRDDVFIDDFEAFPGFVAIAERSAGLRRLRVKPLDGSAERYVDSDEPDYTAWLAFNAEQATGKLRYGFTSLRTPVSTYELDMKTGERKLLKRQTVLGGFDPEKYVTERLFLPARDGAQVPVSLLYRRGFVADGKSPMLVEAYGSYGVSSDPYFDSDVLSLVDRGFVYAIAHVRGGQEMGRRWYEDGKLLRKKNTFFDFIDVSEGLVAHHYAARDGVFAVGGSAGGLLMGAIATMRPDLYRGVIAAVPFVDVITTMTDESIPLTSNEFDEWGDPRIAEYYDYMLSYSPYDEVRARPYPHLLVTTGLWDSQVQYFEPAKWVAKMRAHKTDRNLLLLQTNMEAGHGGKSGRFARMRETALQYAFVLQLAGVRE
ncbi:MAG: S9 family peptidase [Thermoanaerobaculia bacterium]